MGARRKRGDEERMEELWDVKGPEKLKARSATPSSLGGMGDVITTER